MISITVSGQSWQEIQAGIDIILEASRKPQDKGIDNSKQDERSVCQESKKPVCAHCGGKLGQAAIKDRDENLFCSSKCQSWFDYVGQQSQDQSCAYCEGHIRMLTAWTRNGNDFCCKQCADRFDYEYPISHAIIPNPRILNLVKLQTILASYLGPEEIAEIMDRLA
jgi:hypothetical protein